MLKVHFSRRTATIAGALVLALLAGTAWWYAHPSVQGLIRQLAASDRSVRAAAADKLAQVRDVSDIRLLVHYLGDPNPAIRREIAHVLARIGAPAVQPLVEEWAKAVSTRGGWMSYIPWIQGYFTEYSWRPMRIASGASWVLGEIGKPSGPALAGLLSSKDFLVRASAARRLPATYDPSIDNALIAALKNPDLRMEIAGVLGEYRCSAATEALAAVARRRSEAGVAAAWALSRIADPRAVGPLVALLGNSEPGHRYVAVRSLGVLNDSTASQAVIGALGDSDPQVRQCAAVMSWRSGNASAAEALRRAADDSDKRVSLAARAALARIEGNPRGPAYDDVDSHPTCHPTEEEPSAASAHELRLIDQFTETLKEGNAADRVNALERLGSMSPSRETTTAIVLAADDDDPSVRETAALVLANRGDPAAVAAFLKLLKDPEQDVADAGLTVVHLPLSGVERAVIRACNCQGAYVAGTLKYIGGRASVEALEAQLIEASDVYFVDSASTLSQIDLRASRVALGLPAGEARVESTDAQ